MNQPTNTRLGILLRIAIVPPLFWGLVAIPTPAFPGPTDLTGINSVRLGQAAITFSAGFIRRSLPLEGAVSQITGDTQTTGNKLLLGAGDVTYVKLVKPDEFAPGDHLTLYRRVLEVFHPSDKRYLGDLYIMVGVVTVTKITDGLATVRIARSYGPITSGDRAMRFAPPAPPEPAPPDRAAPDLTGTIVALPSQLFLVGQSNVVYIDRGRNDGLYAGDRMEVFRLGAGLPRRLIGEVKILALEESSATALVVRSTANMLRGDTVVFKKSPEPRQGLAKGAAPETLSEELDRLTKSRIEQAAAAPQTSEATQEAGAAPDNLEERLAVLAGKLEFDPGEAPVKPAGLPVLKQISDLLKTAADKQVVIEGHTDIRPIGPTLKRQFPTNQELSEARANGIVRYLVEEGGLDRAAFSIIGHSDRKPVANNSTEEGRKKNRRIEIKLVQKTPSPPRRASEKIERQAATPEPEPMLPPVQEPAPALPPASAVPPAEEPSPALPPGEPASPANQPAAEQPTSTP